MTGSAVGSAYLAGTRTLAQALGAAGLPGFISMKPDHYLNFAIGILLSMGVSFILTIVFWKRFGLEKPEGQKAVKAETAVKAEVKRAEGIETAEDVESAGGAEHTGDAETTTILYSPMKGA